jgi:hypothetical protein
MEYTNHILKTFFIADNKTLEVHYKDDATITLDEIKILLDDIKKFSKNERLKRLMVFSKNAKMELAARIYLQEHNKDHKNLIAAEAIIVCSLTQKMTANFYLKFMKDSYPSKVFTEIEKAKDWLLKQDQ